MQKPIAEHSHARAQGSAVFMMYCINAREFEWLLNVHSERDERRLLLKEGLSRGVHLTRDALDFSPAEAGRLQALPPGLAL